MFNFVIWAIGLAILCWMAVIDLYLIGISWRQHWFLGVAMIVISVIGWEVLAAIFV